MVAAKVSSVSYVAPPIEIGVLTHEVKVAAECSESTGVGLGGDVIRQWWVGPGCQTGYRSGSGPNWKRRPVISWTQIST